MRRRMMLAAALSAAMMATGLSGAGAGATEEVAVRVEPGALTAAGVSASFLERYGVFD